MYEVYSAQRSLAVDISSTDHTLTLTSTANEYPRALYVGVGGTVIGRLAKDGADVTFVGVPTGTVLPFSFKKITRTSTTAASMVFLY